MSRLSSSIRPLAVVLAVAAAFTAGMLIRGGDSESHVHAEATPAAPTQWTCSMHPQILLPEPGQCPLCFMDLIPLEDEPDDDGPRVLTLSESGAALADVRTWPVERRFVASKVSLLGRVVADETRSRTIAAWIAGRLDTLFVDSTGQTVLTGDPMAAIYSPDLYAAQVELINARHGLATLGDGGGALQGSAEATLEAARERLRLWGMSEAQVEAVEARGEASHHVRIQAPTGGVVVHKNAVEGAYVQTGQAIYQVADLTRVWVELEAYESDLPWLRIGQPVTFTVEALPGRSFEGDVVFLDPVLDARTRTVAVRIEADNEDGTLRPGMFARAVVEAALTAEGRPHLEGEDAEAPLVVPATAPLMTGRRAVVYVQLPDRDAPTFEGREVVLGPRAGDHYIVASGLAEGERVVVQGAFKIDSALQIQARPSMMNPDGGGSAPGHDHGGGHAAAVEAPVDVEPDPVDVPADFRDQIGEVLDAYVALQTALAADEEAGASGAAARLASALDAVEMGGLDHDAHMAWMADLATLDPAVDAVAGAEGIEGIREHFEPLSDALWIAVRRYRPDPGRPVRLFHCPMAGPDGADWLQYDTTTANPYYGAAMLRCGSQTDTLAVGGEAR